MVQVGQAHDYDKLSGDHEGMGAPFFLDQLEESLGVKLRHNDQRTPGQNGGKKGHPRAIGIHGGGKDRDGARVNSEIGSEAQGKMRSGKVRVHNPFGNASRTGAVNDVKVILIGKGAHGFLIRGIAKPTLIRVPAWSLEAHGEKIFFGDILQSLSVRYEEPVQLRPNE